MSVDSCFAGSASEQTAKKLLELSRGSSPAPVESKLPSVIDGSITTLTAEDFGDATSIKDYAFYKCAGLMSVTVPSSVTSIGGYAFYYIGEDATITILSTTPPYLADDADSTFQGQCTIYVPASAVDAYKATWSKIAGQIQAIPEA